MLNKILETIDNDKEIKEDRSEEKKAILTEH